MTLAQCLRDRLAPILGRSAKPALHALVLLAAAGLGVAAAAASDAASGGVMLAQYYGSPPPQNYPPPPYGGQPAPQPYGGQPYGAQPAPPPYGAQPQPGYPPPGADQGEGSEPLHISDATYAADPRTQCDASGAMRSLCEDKRVCFVRADDRLCGDPAPGRRKTLIIGYKCGGKRREVRVEQGGSVRLRC